MADKKFNIEITAKDKASKAIANVGKSFNSLTAPLSDIKSVMGTLGRESGLTQIGDHFSEMGRAAGEAAREVANVGTPIAALSGGMGVAALVSLSRQFSAAGMHAKESAASIGMGPTALQEMQQVAALSDISADQMTAGLQQLGTTLNDVLNKRGDARTMTLMNQLKIVTRKTASGAVDAADAFYQLADAVARQPTPQTQQLVADQFGLGGLLPLLRKGSAGVKQLQAEIRETHATLSPEQIEKAEKLHLAYGRLGHAMEGVGNKIGENLAMMEPVITKAAAFIDKNQTLVTMLTAAAAAITGVVAAYKIVMGVRMAAAVLGTLRAAAAAGPVAAAVGAAGTGLGAAAVGGAAGVGAVAAPAIAAAEIGTVAAAAGASAGGVALAPVAAAGVLLGLTGWAAYDAVKIANRQAGMRHGSAAGAVGGQTGLAAGLGAALGQQRAGVAPATPPGIMLGDPLPDTPYSTRRKAAGSDDDGQGAKGKVEVEVTFTGAPTNMRATTRMSGDVAGSTRIGYSMPTLVSP